jgi:hypothetical protein
MEQQRNFYTFRKVLTNYFTVCLSFRRNLGYIFKIKQLIFLRNDKETSIPFEDFKELFYRMFVIPEESRLYF